jgi:hypothetical protein
MFEYRARIGYISPSVIELNAYQFYRISPRDLGLIASPAWFLSRSYASLGC